MCNVADLVRISVGIEDLDDFIEDLARAFAIVPTLVRAADDHHDKLKTSDSKSLAADRVLAAMCTALSPNTLLIRDAFERN